LRVLLLSSTMDTGGQGHRIVELFDSEDGWDVRSMSKDNAYMAYPTDLPYRKRHLEELYQKADVIHVRNDFSLYDPCAAKFGPKPVVYHAHGTKVRGDPNRWVRECRKRNAQILVSTLDLWLLTPGDATWLPSPYRIET
jgi:hypothetical protein